MNETGKGRSPLASGTSGKDISNLYDSIKNNVTHEKTAHTSRK